MLLSRKTVFGPHSYGIFVILFLFLVLVVGLAFRQVGFSSETTVLILGAT